jgi:RNA polymerase sigma-70 factor (ECF subfamily)
MSFSELHTTHMHGLILRMREEDAEAADRLIRAAVGRMEALARHELRRSPVLRRWHDAEDVLQNALMRLQRALHRVQPASMRDFHGLAAEMIRRESIDLARQLRGAQGLAANVESREGEEPAAVVETADELELWTALHEEAGRLPESQAEVFRLRYYNGLKNGEIAQLLGVTEETVGQTWRRACASLTTRLARRQG